MIDSELKQLYQEVIMDHSKKPRNFGSIDPYSHKAMGNNPLCGDQLVVFAHVNNQGVIENLAFQGKGCAISIASSSMMTQMLKGKTLKQAKNLYEAFHCLAALDDDVSVASDLEDDLDKLKVFQGVRQFPMRVKCATLGWHTLDAALEGKTEVSTE